MLKCLSRPEKSIKYCFYALFSLLAGNSGVIPQDFLLLKEKEFDWENIRELMKLLSDEIAQKKDFFNRFFEQSLDEGLF